jgi:hypothetical protein
VQPCRTGSASGEATESERRVLVEELVEKVAVFPDHLEATIAGAPTVKASGLVYSAVAWGGF